MKSRLVLIPNFIGKFDPNYLPKRTVDETHQITHFIVERIKTARAFLKAINHPTPQNDFVFCELDKHNDYSGFKEFFNLHIGNQSIGLISEAGLPAIADPGSEVVKFAHQKQISVLPLSGSSSIFLALMASGFDGQNFAFNGYLEIDARERVKQLKDLEIRARKQTQVMMEAPYRNNQFLKFLVANLQNDTRLAIAANIESENEIIRSKMVKEWTENEVDLHKQPCIFIIKA